MRTLLFAVIRVSCLFFTNQVLSLSLTKDFKGRGLVMGEAGFRAKTSFSQAFFQWACPFCECKSIAVSCLSCPVFEALHLSPCLSICLVCEIDRHRVYGTDAPAVGKLEHLWSVRLQSLPPCAPADTRNWLNGGKAGRWKLQGFKGRCQLYRRHLELVSLQQYFKAHLWIRFICWLSICKIIHWHAKINSVQRTWK